MLTLVRPVPHVPAPRSHPVPEVIAGEGPAIRSSSKAPWPGARTVASDAGVTADWSAMAWVSDDGRWWLCRERPGPTHFAELVALAAAVSHHPDRRLRVLTDLDALAGLVTGWRAGRVHRWPSLHRNRDDRLERIVAVLQRRVAERAGRHDEVTAKHVRGHSGHPLNTAADRLARHALTAQRIDPRRCQEIVDTCLGRDPRAVGHPGTRLVLLDAGVKGPDIAIAVRSRYGPGCALILRDDLGHLVLGERDEHAADLAVRMAEFALDAGQHVICEGPLGGGRDRRALLDLARRHHGTTSVFRSEACRRLCPLEGAGIAERVIAPDVSADQASGLVLRALSAFAGG